VEVRDVLGLRLVHLQVLFRQGGGTETRQGLAVALVAEGPLRLGVHREGEASQYSGHPVVKVLKQKSSVAVKGKR